MNILVEKKYIEEMACGANFAYVLNDIASFLSTEYKVLQSQTNNCFVPCMKMMYNGKVQLYYLTKGLKPFSIIIPNLDADNFLTIISNVFAAITDVKHNGFLSCQNVDISFERIYVDPATYKVKLVYIPINKRVHDDVDSFENELRTALVKLILGVDTLSTPKTTQFSSHLSDGTKTIEDLHRFLVNPPNPPKPGPIERETGILMRIVAMNAPEKFEIGITKDNFIIGRKQEGCDGVIGFNNMIGRTHCKINMRGNQYTITDLQSKNGTSVNGVRLQPDLPHPIKNGDIIRLANSDFQVRIG